MKEKKKINKKKPSGPKKAYFVYILQLQNNTLYTGATQNLEKRLQAHQAKKGARLTAAMGVKKMVYHEQLPTWSKALKREYAIKQLTRAQKLTLIQTQK